MAAGSCLGGAGDVLFAIALFLHLVRRLVKLLLGVLQFRVTPVVPAAGEKDLGAER